VGFIMCYAMDVVTAEVLRCTVLFVGCLTTLSAAGIYRIGLQDD
jgi:hypothetical protein